MTSSYSFDVFLKNHASMGFIYSLSGIREDMDTCGFSELLSFLMSQPMLDLDTREDPDILSMLDFLQKQSGLPYSWEDYMDMETGEHPIIHKYHILADLFALRKHAFQTTTYCSRIRSYQSYHLGKGVDMFSQAIRSAYGPFCQHALKTVYECDVQIKEILERDLRENADRDFLWRSIA